MLIASWGKIAFFTFTVLYLPLTHSNQLLKPVSYVGSYSDCALRSVVHVLHEVNKLSLE